MSTLASAAWLLPAGILIQAEARLCSCALLYRRQENTKQLLHQWWDVGTLGKFIRPYDQGALKYIMKRYLTDLLGTKNIYNDSDYRQPANQSPVLGELYKHMEQLKMASDFGFIGLDAAHDATRVSLHSCNGRWEGCIPKDAPALVHHSGSSLFWQDKQQHYRMLMRALTAWPMLHVDAAVSERTSP